MKPRAKALKAFDKDLEHGIVSCKIPTKLFEIGSEISFVKFFIEKSVLLQWIVVNGGTTGAHFCSFSCILRNIFFKLRGP